MLKYILFDLDGTLTESGPGIMAGVRYALRTVGVEEADEEKLSLFVGPPLERSFSELYGFDDGTIKNLIASYREYYNDKGVFENAPYEGVDDALKELRAAGYLLAVASAKPQDMVDKVLEHFDLERYFSEIVGTTPDTPLTTKERVIAEALRRIAKARGVESADEIKPDCVMIGDRKDDIAGADKNGLRAVGVRWGYAPKGELEATSAIAIVNDPKDLTTFLRGL